MTCHPVFRNVRKILEEMHVILAPDARYEKPFPDILMNSFKNNKSLKNHLIRSQPLHNDGIGRSKPCEGKKPPFHLCESMKDKSTFKSRHLDEVHKIKSSYNFNSKKGVYLLECQVFCEQCVHSTKTNFYLREYSDIKDWAIILTP